MATITPLQLRTQDLPGVGNAVVLQNINTFFRQVQEALTKGLTLTVNSNASVQGHTVTTDGSGNIAPLTFKHNLTGRCISLLIGDVTKSGGGTVAALGLNWVDDGNGSVTISAITGLAVSSSYTVQFILLAG